MRQHRPSFFYWAFLSASAAAALAIAEGEAPEWSSLTSGLSSPEALKEGGFDLWVSECLAPMEEAWNTPCSEGFPCNTGTKIIFGISNYEFIDRPQDKPAGGQCMVFGQNCANKNCEWPYTEEEENAMFAGMSDNPHTDILNLPAKVLFPQNAADIVKAVEFATANNIDIKVKSTGHSSFGDSTGADALLINMRSYPKYADPDDGDNGLGAIVECDDPASGEQDDVLARTMACNLVQARGLSAYLRVGGGQIFDEVLRTIMNWNQADAKNKKYHIVSGASGTVGAAGGWLAGGGLGLSQNGRDFGFGIDQVVLYEMVLPGGQHVRFGPVGWEDAGEEYQQPKTTEVAGYCNSNPHESDEAMWEWVECNDSIPFEDLWFALRGGGAGGWGVVTSVFYQLQNKPGDMDFTVFGPLSEDVKEVMTPIYVDFYLDFFADPDALPDVTVEQSNSCGSYITAHSFVTTKANFYFCFNGAGQVFASAWKNYVLGRQGSLIAAGLTEEEISTAADSVTIITFPSYPYYGNNLPPELSSLQNAGTPEGRTADLNPAIFVKRSGNNDDNGMNMFQVPLDIVLEKKAALSSLISRITLRTNKLEAYQMGGNHRTAHDQMTSMPPASRDAAFMLEVIDYKDQEELLALIFEGQGGEDISFPGLYCHNIAMPNDYGPQKNDWTKPCDPSWSKEEKKNNCVSFQEAVWGTELLEKLESIQNALDPKSLFIQGYGVNGKGPLVGVDEGAGSASTGKVGGISKCDDSMASPLAFGCHMDSILEITYPGGVQKCGDTVTVSQVADAPTVKMMLIDDSTALYTVLMLDTAVSEVHPILHFGAVNVAGASLKDGVNLDDIDSFMEHRGPAPPSPEMVPGIENVPFNYELVIAAQAGHVEDPTVDSPINFDYNSFLAANTVGEKISSYFTTGHCVTSNGDDSENDMDSSTEFEDDETAGTPASAGYCCATASKVAVAVVVAALTLH